MSESKPRRYRALLDGALVAGGSEGKVARKDNGEVIGLAPVFGAEDLDKAAAAAERASDATRRLPGFERARALEKARHALSDRREELARMLAMEAGKPIKSARAEVERALHTFAVGVEEATRLHGELLPLDAVPHAKGRLGLVRRVPVGPVLGISPFNFPCNLVAHKIVPAIASGCSIVLKPASATPLSALLLGEILHESGLPPGAVNIVPAPAPLAEKLAADPRFALLTFTGSADVGWRLKGLAARKRVVLELGGNAAVVVHDDADLDVAAAKIAAGAFGYAGQSCISVQRVLCARPRLPDLTERLVARARALKVGDILVEDTDVGPMIDEAAAARTEERIREAASRGAKVLCGGGRRGAFVSPAVLSGVPHDAALWRQEAFAPVCVVEPYDTWEQALATVNDSEFGLQAGIFTRDIGRIMSAWQELRVGGVMVNEVPTWRVDHMPYGGTKASGLGREGIRYAIEDMTEPRLLVLDAGT